MLFNHILSVPDPQRIRCTLESTMFALHPVQNEGEVLVRHYLSINGVVLHLTELLTDQGA